MAYLPFSGWNNSFFGVQRGVMFSMRLPVHEDPLYRKAIREKREPDDSVTALHTRRIWVINEDGADPESERIILRACRFSHDGLTDRRSTAGSKP